MAALPSDLRAVIFQSTPSARRATFAFSHSSGDGSFQSTPSVGRATPKRNVEHGKHHISIHALREEGDCSSGRERSPAPNFNPRPPRGGRRCYSKPQERRSVFQSTPSARRATKVAGPQESTERFQSTPSARRATDIRFCFFDSIRISIHALREEGDRKIGAGRCFGRLFQSTPSVGRATNGIQLGLQRIGISIHALRGEGDPSTRPAGAAWWYFNPRPPWGGRRVMRLQGHITPKFQSTPSVGRATRILAGDGRASRISIHALRGEGDAAALAAAAGFSNFNPRPPWGGRLITASFSRTSKIYFNPRPPWGGRPFIAGGFSAHADFNPRPPWGGRLLIGGNIMEAMLFQSTPSVGRATMDQPITRAEHEISIHALRGEGDRLTPSSVYPFPNFNPRPPWGGRPDRRSSGLPSCRNFNPRPPWGGRHGCRGPCLQFRRFQSTPSVGRATASAWKPPHG